MADGTVTQLPKDHRVNLQETKHQSLSVFTESQPSGEREKEEGLCINNRIID